MLIRSSSPEHRSPSVSEDKRRRGRPNWREELEADRREQLKASKRVHCPEKEGIATRSTALSSTHLPAGHQR